MQLLLSEDLLLGFGVFTQFSSLLPPSHNSRNRRKTKQEKETLMSRKLPLFILFGCAMPAFEFSPEKRADRIQNSFSKRSTPDYPQKNPGTTIKGYFVVLLIILLVHLFSSSVFSRENDRQVLLGKLTDSLLPNSIRRREYTTLLVAVCLKDPLEGGNEGWSPQSWIQECWGGVLTSYTCTEPPIFFRLAIWFPQMSI